MQALQYTWPHRVTQQSSIGFRQTVQVNQCSSASILILKDFCPYIFQCSMFYSQIIARREYRKDLFYVLKYDQIDFDLEVGFEIDQQIYNKNISSQIKSMAFVIPKAEKQSFYHDDPDKPGPGTYLQNTKYSKVVEHCAPFNKSELKTSIFEVEPTNYGPGSYHPQHLKDINKPIKTTSNSHMFMSRVERFHYEKNQGGQQRNSNNKQLTSEQYLNNRGLYKYQDSKAYMSEPRLNQNYVMTNPSNNQEYKKRLQKSKEAIKEIRENNNKKKVQSIRNNKDFVRVILASTANTETHINKFYHKSIMGKTLGPGSYGVNTKSKPRHVSAWEKEKPIRFSSDGNDVPGPGSYQQSQNFKLRKNARLSASFACTEMKSHLDSLIYRTNIPLKAVILEKKKIKDTTPGPGSYNPAINHKDKKSFNYSVHTNFGTQNRSFIDENRVNRKEQVCPGPGAYEDINVAKKNSKCNHIIKEIRNQIFGKKKFEDHLKKSRKETVDRSQLEQQFTKGKFERKNRLHHKVYSLQQRCFSKFGNMAQEQRFKSNPKYYQPGPGEYDQNLNKALLKNQSSVFKSQTKKGAFEMKPSQSHTQFYNINRSDIGYKAEKMKRYIENLRKINIERVPFETSAKRFPEEKTLNQDDDERGMPNILNDSRSFVRKQVHIQKPNLPSSNFISKSKRDIFVSEHSKVMKREGPVNANEHQNNKMYGMPGPGQYQVKTNYQGKNCELEKKSFNKNYNQKLNKKKKHRTKSQYEGPKQEILSRSQSFVQKNA